jgi:predicted secreted protein
MAETIGAGATLHYDLDTLVAGTPTYVLLGYITSVSMPGAEADSIDVTSSTSYASALNVRVRKYVKGLVEGGEVELGVLMDYATYKIVYDEIQTDNLDLNAFKVTVPLSGTFQFDGFFKAVEYEAPQDEAIAGTVTIQVSSKVTFAALP